MESEKRRRWSTTTFLLGFAATLVMLLVIALEFLIPLTLALAAAVMLGGWYEKLVVALGGRRRISALLMSFATIVAFMIPFAFISLKLVKSLVPLVNRIGDAIGSGAFTARIARVVPDSWSDAFAELDIGSFEAQLHDALGALAGRLGAFATAIPGAVAGLLVDGFVMVVALYSFFVNGPRLRHQIIEATPMERHYTHNLLSTIAVSIRTVFAASFITAVIQFVIGYIGFRIVGLPQALGLAAVMALFSFVFSLVPVLGSGLVWVPASVWLVATGRPIAGVFLLGWGILVLGSIDNVVKPLYTKGKLQLSPLIVFVTLFGGVAVFGPIGAVLGPLLAALAAAFLHIWTNDFLEDATPPPPVAPVARKRRLWSGLKRPQNA